MLGTLALGGALFHRLGNGRLYTALAKGVGIVSGRERMCSVEIAPDVWFTFDLGDFYWNRLAFAGFSYEPELSHLLKLTQDIPYTFLDCGANYGYWSLLVGAGVYGAHRVVAIEASPKTLPHLRHNVRAVSDMVDVLHGAIASESDQLVTLYERGSHAGASIRHQWLGNERALSATFDIPSISLDEVVRRAGIAETDPIIVKLDVEGAEIDALRGGGRILHGNCMIVFEEYGGEPESLVARFAIHDLALDIFYMTDTGQLIPVRDVAHVQSLKANPRRGYNFIGVPPGTVFHRRLATASRTEQPAAIVPVPALGHQGPGS